MAGFDFWTTFFALSALLGLGISVWLFRQRKRYAAFLWLGAIVLSFSLIVMEWVLWWTEHIHAVPLLKGITFAFPFFTGVMLLGYYRAAFPDDHHKQTKPGFWHYLPGLLFLLKISPMYFHNIGWKVPDWGRFTFIDRNLDAAFYLMMLHFAVYPLLIHRAYRHRIEADPEMLRWHRCLLLAYSGIVAGYVVHHILSLMGLMSLRLDFLIAGCIMVFMAVVAWLGVVHRRILAGETFIEAILPTKYHKSALDKADSVLLASRILTAFEQDKIYLDPDLTLAALSQKLGSKRHHVSQVINTRFEMSYPDFVSKWRIKTAQELLLKSGKKELIIKEIAWASGFNTKAAFNLAFKKWTGMTPTEFRQNLD